MKTFDFSDFEREARAAGYEEVLERRWLPRAIVEAHTHPFAVRALVVEGEMWLTVNGTIRHLQIGDSFELGRDVPHSERYGDTGAKYWVARRSSSEQAG